MKFSPISVLLSVLLTPSLVLAQHEHMKSAKPVPKSTQAGMEDHSMHMNGMEKPDSMPHHMTHSFSLSLPMNRNGSGTGWQPDETPLYAYMKHLKKWNFMAHGSIFARYTAQNFNNSSYRGSAREFSFPSWVMGMAQRQIGKRGLFSFRAMLSADRILDGGSGYPLVFQSGETWQGAPLIDRQHPHDLFSELSIAYTHRINKKMDVTIYAGYPGEPALGPTAFMHRMSAFNNPDAALGHHWQDATHITFGVVTAGVRYGKFKLEASSFTGREPDENRYNFDKPLFDSYSARLWFNPNENWAIQVSRGFIKDPEAIHVNDDIHRTTASVQHSLRLYGDNRWISSSIVGGMNEHEDHEREYSALAETNLQIDKWGFYGRYEWVQKSAEELNIAWFDHNEKDLFPISVVSLGINRQILSFKNTLLQAGIQVSLHFNQPQLKPTYGDTPLSGQVYLRITPAMVNMW